MTSNPGHKRDQADHGEHHGEGDGGVGGDRVEKEVDYGRHGAGEALAGMMVQDITEIKDRFRDGEWMNRWRKERQAGVEGLKTPKWEQFYKMG